MSEPTPNRARDPVRDATTVLLWGLAFYAGSLLAGAWLVKSKLGASAVQAALAEWGAGRVGITWNDPEAPPPPWTDLARRFGRGAAFGLAAGALVVTFALLTRAAKLAPGPPIVSQLALGLFASGLAAVRDELLLRGLVLRALGDSATATVGAVACAGAAAAAAFGAGHTAPAELGVAALGGAVFASLWHVDRGAWLAVGAHATWSFATGSVIRGGLIDVRPMTGLWGGGDAGIEGSLATLVALAPVAAFAIARARVPADESDQRHGRWR